MLSMTRCAHQKVVIARTTLPSMEGSAWLPDMKLPPQHANTGNRFAWSLVGVK